MQARLYCTGAEPYADPGDPGPGALAAGVTRIEQRETGGWGQLASPRAEATSDNVLSPRS